VARALALPVLALQLVATAVGAIDNALFMAEARAWVGNDFVDLLSLAVPAAPLAAGLVVLAVWLTLRAVVDRFSLGRPSPALVARQVTLEAAEH
jgi:hypothetical protein